MMILSDTLVVMLISSGRLGLPIPASRLSYTFFVYMITIANAICLILLGRSLHVWEQVPSVREELSQHDSRKEINETNVS